MWFGPRTPPPRRPPPPAPAPPVPPGMMAEFEAKPFGSHGAMLPVPAPQPTQVVEEFTIPPPPWVRADGSLDFENYQAEPPPAEPRPPALAALKAAEPGGGYNPPAYGPPVTSEPLKRVEFPPPDWRQVEREAVKQQAADRVEAARKVLAEIGAEEQPARYPPPRRPA